MPNWCYNDLEIRANDEESEKELKKFKESSIIYKKEDNTNEQVLTFKGVCPRPKSLDITAGSMVDRAIMYLEAKDGDLTKITKYVKKDDQKVRSKVSIKSRISAAMKNLDEQLSINDLTEGKMAIDNIKKHGHQDWYNWSIENWGTKWDASTSDIDYDDEWIRISFDTAWSPPEAWIQALTNKFPNLEIIVKVTEESDAYMGYICAYQGKINSSYAEPNMPS